MRESGNYKHGGTGTHLHIVWKKMKIRCYAPSNREYPVYGGKGIEVYEEWRESFEEFREWALMSGYAPHKDLRRIHEDDDFSPWNCHWVLSKYKDERGKKVVEIEINGVKKTLKQWSEESGVSYAVMHARNTKGVTGEALLQSVEKTRSPSFPVEINGESKTIPQWARASGISSSAIHSRYKAGKRGEELLKPVRKRKAKETNLSEQGE